MTEAERIVASVATAPNEEAIERALRPTTLAEYVGQPKVREQLAIFIEAAKKRGESLDTRACFRRPAGSRQDHAGSHHRRSRWGSICGRPQALLETARRSGGDPDESREKNRCAFIDEIHRLSASEEILYPALEGLSDRHLSGDGPAARSIKIDLPPFTLVGATTRAGMLTNPLRDRFGIVARLEFYSADELAAIVRRSARLLKAHLTEEGAREIAHRSRGTPRVANRLLRRVRDYAEVKGTGEISQSVADAALAMLEVDRLGLDIMDRKLLARGHRKIRARPGGHRQSCGCGRRGTRLRWKTLSSPT